MLRMALFPRQFAGKYIAGEVFHKISPKYIAGEAFQMKRKSASAVTSRDNSREDHEQDHQAGQDAVDGQDYYGPDPHVPDPVDPE